MAMPVYTSSGALIDVNNGAGAHTKGAFVTIMAATPSDSSRAYFGLAKAESDNQRHMSDWAKGAAGVEVVIIANFPYDPGGAIMAGFCSMYEIDILSGTRISCRTQGQDVGGDKHIKVWVMHENRALGGLSATVTYGAITATSKGTAVDPGAVNDTKGSYVEIIASTTLAHKAWHIYFEKNLPADADLLNWTADFSTGAAGVEVIAIPDITIKAGSTGKACPTEEWLPLVVALGTRIAIRVKCSDVSDATSRILCFILVGCDSLG